MKRIKRGSQKRNLGGQIIERLTERAKLTKTYKNEDNVKRRNGKVIC
jgi:hypothetical protein